MDVRDTYFKVVDHIQNSMSDKKTSSREKVALRYIMRQINTAYKNYIEATTISEDVRKQNMRDVNNAMADAA